MANNTSTTTDLTGQLLVTTNSSSRLNFQIQSINVKLDRTDFSLWRNTVLLALQAFELEAHILTDDSSPQYKPQTVDVTTPPGSNSEYITWRHCDRFVLLWLRSTLSERALATIVRATTARQAWTTIDRTFKAQSRARRMALKNQLQSLLKGSLSIIEYFEKKRAIADALDENFQHISNEDLTGYILNGLDSLYGPFITSFMMRPEETNVDDLLGLLLLEEERIE
ncbi:uncharacterized protein LOC109847214 [Asparagus officinalis]|uniref:uncharacterized protein LOC109847214 n=1 Tax=Asparagus officinalis TaxID=4686 RepID=UPI00098E0C86|nr:uncharacterized protein LOC109847214 [Asparagus officinalis]